MTKMMIAAALMGLLTAVCLAQPAAEAPNGSSLVKEGNSVVDSSNGFAVDLYAKLAADNTGNLFFSPGSIHTALAMTYAGAAGKTAEQMAKTLHFTLPADKLNTAFGDLLAKLNKPSMMEANEPAYQLVVANALWGQKGYGFKLDFIQLLAKSYGAGLNEVDFKQTEQARKTINDWVAQRTKDKIKDLIPTGVLSDLTRLVLTNAIYFKSNWSEQFDKGATQDGTFNVSADKSVTVPMMHAQETFRYGETAVLQILELPYTGHDLSMVILLPKEVDGVKDTKKGGLTAANIGMWLKEAKAVSVDVTMPKFRFSSDLMLADTLKSMGMTDAFDADKANFSGITDKEKLFIGSVIHKAFVAVDEDGTEAAAVTAVEMRPTALPPKEVKVFKADHPFIFLIRHKATGEILFMGRMANPKGE